MPLIRYNHFNVTCPGQRWSHLPNLLKVGTGAFLSQYMMWLAACLNTEDRSVFSAWNTQENRPRLTEKNLWKSTSSSMPAVASIALANNLPLLHPETFYCLRWCPKFQETCVNVCAPHWHTRESSTYAHTDRAIAKQKYCHSTACSATGPKRSWFFGSATGLQKSWHCGSATDQRDRGFGSVTEIGVLWQCVLSVSTCVYV